MRLSKFFKNWWRRASAASKTDAVLALFAFASKVYSVGFALWMAGAKFSAWSGPGTHAFWVFVCSLAYTTALPYFPKRVSAKWVTEDRRRTMATAVAVSEITSAVWNRALRPEQKHALFNRLLSAIKSEVEGITGDHEGIYFNVSLLLDDNADTLKVVCRANQDRPLKSYKKAELMISESLTTGDTYYEPECELADKPYRAIFAMPLVSIPESSRALAYGVVSVDSSKPHCFDGLQDEIEIKTLVYLNLLKLVIVADESLRNGKGRKNARKN